MDNIVSNIKLKGDKAIESVPAVKDKALRINLNDNIYGTFAEIGAGQETVRHFSVQGDHQALLQKQCRPMTKTLVTLFMGWKMTVVTSPKAA